MRIALTEGISAFVFGSAVRDRRSARDLDVLFVYDPTRIAPAMIYGVLGPTISQLSELSGLPVHPVVLTIAEEHADAFLNRSRAIPLIGWLAETTVHTLRWPAGLRSNAII